MPTAVAHGSFALTFAADASSFGVLPRAVGQVVQPRGLSTVTRGNRPWIAFAPFSSSCNLARSSWDSTCSTAAPPDAAAAGSTWAVVVGTAAAAMATSAARLRPSRHRAHRRARCLARAGRFSQHGTRCHGLTMQSFAETHSEAQAVSEPIADLENHTEVGQSAGMEGVSNGSGRIGVVLLNIGTPASTDVEDVREYLAKFLSDERVIEMDDPEARQAVIQALLKSSPAKSAEAYQKIWDPERGSPLLYHTEDLAESLQRQLGGEYEVCIGFQYSEPSVETALLRLMSLSISNIVLVPMYPHFAQATGASFLANTCRVAAEVDCRAYLQVVRPFYKNPGYIGAAVPIIAQHIGPQGRDVDHIVFSFHGIPEKSQLLLATEHCYRTQCLETAELMAHALGLPEGHWSVAFQSRASVRGSIQWTQPFTDEHLATLPEQGKKRVAICAPSYTADCIETLGELGNDGREIFTTAGGEELTVIPCINSSDVWARNLAQMIHDMPRTVEEAVQRAGSATDFWAM